jgi:hypothetical protein
MKPMIATRRRGTRSRRSASTRSGKRVVNERRRAAWTLTQLLRAMVANSRSPWPLIVRASGPISMVPSGSPGRVKTSGRAARTKGRAKNAERARRNGPRRASVESVARPTQPIARAANDPTGSRLMARMMPPVRTNFRRGSTRWTRLSRAR